MHAQPLSLLQHLPSPPRTTRKGLRSALLHGVVEGEAREDGSRARRGAIRIDLQQPLVDLLQVCVAGVSGACRSSKLRVQRLAQPLRVRMCSSKQVKRRARAAVRARLQALGGAVSGLGAQRRRRVYALRQQRRLLCLQLRALHVAL